ncbi:MAG: DoxX family protein [Streptosporangiales bacterium]|nr:DoxX family protein [Streptosporangiales bacterium]
MTRGTSSMKISSCHSRYPHRRFFGGIMANEITAREAPAQAGTSRGVNALLWVLQAFAAAGFVFGAFGKFTAFPAAVEVFQSMGTAGWMPYVIAPLEVLGAIALVVPQLRLYGLAAVAFVALTVGAVISHLVWGGNPMSAVMLLVISAAIAWGRRSNTADLFARLGRR